MLEDAIRKWNPLWADLKSLEKLSGIQRYVEADILKSSNLRHIKDIIGVRRSGKTTILYQTIKGLIEKGKNQKEIVFLNFDDPEINAADFNEILKALDKINPEIKYAFFDEIQQKTGWERWIRTIYDLKRFKQIFVSGSSASLLSQDIGRVLTGRHLTFQIFPLSFREYLKFNGWSDFSEDFLRYNKNKVLHLLSKYIKNGGFPETVGKNEDDVKMILTNVYNDILSRDIASRFNVSYETVRKISFFLITNATKEFSFRKISDAVGVSVETAEKYVELLTESFLIMILDAFSYKAKSQLKQNKKTYCIDLGLRNAVSFRFSEDFGKLAENMVFLELKMRGKEIYYWRDKVELDFVVKEGTKITGLINVCWDIKESETKKREVKSILAGMEFFKLKEGIILTEDYENEEIVNNMKITYCPLWLWLLRE